MLIAVVQAMLSKGGVWRQRSLMGMTILGLLWVLGLLGAQLVFPVARIFAF